MLALLTETAGGNGEELPRDETIGMITDDERFDKADAEVALESLQNSGYVYYVEEDVRITPTDN